MSPLVSLAAAVLVALPYLIGLPLRMSRTTTRRAFISAAAGISVAYAFVDLLPELAEMQARFVEVTEHLRLPFAEYRVYLAAFVGFSVFHYLEAMAVSSRDEDHSASFGHGEGGRVYRAHIVGFALYSSLIGYVLGAEAEERSLHFLVFYSLAMALHFLIVDHSLRQEHGGTYDRSGRWVLATAVFLGWAVGTFVAVPERVVTTLGGFVAGGVVLNSIKDEMPEGGEGKVLPFLMAGLIYAFVLIAA